ncbi:hypothetical protein HLB42_21585 (plasmid) [Deinococcus sp. D7000]|nr:hypothetical protein HLB42_13860 [Deinococcus sp. D7000]QLG13534.1 hypothetical protein HLB42_21585 [Deinococcus sp. D7000]
METFVRDHSSGRLINANRIKTLKIYPEEKPKPGTRHVKDPETNQWVQPPESFEETGRYEVRAWLDDDKEAIVMKLFDTEEEAEQFLSEAFNIV